MVPPVAEQYVLSVKENELVISGRGEGGGWFVAMQFASSTSCTHACLIAFDDEGNATSFSTLMR